MARSQSAAKNYLQAAVDGRAYAFDKHTGGVLWSIPFPSPFNGQPVLKAGRVYFGSEDGTLLALEEATGRVLWRYRTKGAVRGPVAVDRENVSSVRVTVTFTP